MDPNISEHCIVRFHDTEVEVTKTQLDKISIALKTAIAEDEYSTIVNSPFPLREICLEDYGVKNTDIKTK